MNIYDQDLGKNAANYQPQTPLTFLSHAERVYPDKLAVVHGDACYCYRELARRCRRLASALVARGVGRGDTVSVMAPNVPALLEAHYGVPMSGAVLNALNYRLDAPTIAFILNHAQSKVLLTDTEFAPVIKRVLAQLGRGILVIDINDVHIDDTPGAEQLGELDYEAFLATGDSEFSDWQLPDDEWNAISLNYTSGTTGNPKGVVYHHRGAFVNALGNALVFGLNAKSVYLWTLPMFHCNGWTYPWAVTAVGATHVCLRQVDPALIFPLLSQQKVTHMCGAPIVLNMLIHAPDNVKQPFAQTVEVATGGAAPPSTVISAMERMGFKVTHLYGLTETYGPATYCAWQAHWEQLALDERSAYMARQGVHYATMTDSMVADPKTMEPVPADGETIGELMLKGNTVMKGYLKNANASAEAFRGGWFHSGDLGVMHPNGYVEIKDRSKDIIISGGENISSLEIEEVLYKHDDIMEAAVVAKPDQTWGETPCAFVTLKPGAAPVSEQDIIDFCRANMAHFKAPKTVMFVDLPKTQTGKIQKFVLRDRAAEL
ncbi:MAG: long-chain-fatty-acid--CoA ligase [Gammaproteobacteria bacterium]|nr:long-chain-fatty-acid--CoA ligase [Gammaproteobacteria bacterium]